MNFKLPLYLIFSIMSFSAFASTHNYDLESSVDYVDQSGLKNIAPIIVRLDRDYENICHSIQRRCPKILPAIEFAPEEKNLIVHLPCQFVSNIFGSLTTIHWEIYDTNLSSLFKSRFPTGATKIAFCSLSYEEELISDLENAWDSNNTTVPRNLRWEGNFLEKSKSQDLLNYIFKTNHHKGVIIGECHIDMYARYWIIQWLPRLVQDYGVEELALEVLPRELQGVVNLYMNADKSSEMPDDLKMYLDLSDSINNWFSVPTELETWSSYSNLIKQAKAAGIKSILAIDDAKYCFPVNVAATDNEYFVERAVAMNQISAKILSAPQVGNRLILCGASHSTQYAQNGKLVHGLQDLTGFPTVNIFSSIADKNIQKSSIIFNLNQEWQDVDGVQSKAPNFTLHKLISNN